MIFSESLVRVLDNSGVRLAKCLRLYNKLDYGTVGDSMLVSVRKYIPNKKIKKGMMFKAVIIKVKKNVYRKTGQYLKSNVNAVVLIKKEENAPIAKRIKSLVFFELRKKGYSRILSMATGIL
jgi:large subunit ribosomal protein L14